MLLSHATLLVFPKENNLVLTGIRFLGTVGVDLFFVLSGFLIGSIILKQLKLGKTRFKDFMYFWIRRWFRTLPNYFLVLILNVILFYLFSGEIIEGLKLYFLFLQNFWTPQPDFYTESWSLSIEEYAYIIGPLLMFLSILIAKKASKTKLFLISSLLVIIISVLLRYQFHLSHSIDSVETWSKSLRKIVIYRMDSIYYGFIFVYIMNIKEAVFRQFNKVFFWTGILLFLGVHLLIFSTNMTPVNSRLFFNVIYLPLLSLNLLLFFPYAITITTNKQVEKLVTELSVLSYAMYLLNYSVVLLSIKYFMGFCSDSILIRIMALLIYCLLTVYLSKGLYRYFEKPMTNLRDKSFFKAKFS